MQRRGLMGPQNLVPVDGYADSTTYYQHGAHLVAGSIPGQGLEAVSAGLNLTLWAASVLVLPLGMAALASAFRARPIAIVVAPVAASVAPDLVFGQLGLWAFAVSLCVAPGVIYAGVAFVRTHSLSSAGTVALSLAGLFLIHPHGYLIASIALGATLLLLRDRATQPNGPLPARSVPVALMLCGALAVAITLPWYVLSNEVQTFSTALQLRDPPFDGVGVVFRQMLLGQRIGPGTGDPSNTLLGAGTWAAAVFLASRRRHASVLIPWSALAAMTIITAGGSGRIHSVVGGLWLSDWYRPAAGYALLGALVLALGVDEVVMSLSPTTQRRALFDRLGRALLAVLAFAVILVQTPNARSDLVLLYGPWLGPVEEDGATDRRPEGSPLNTQSTQIPILGPGQAQALDVLAEVTPPGTRVMNWWPDGSPWMYGAHGLVPVQTYAITSVDWDDALFVQQHLHDIEWYDHVIEALVRLEVCSAFAAEGHLDAGTRPEWTQRAVLPGFTLVYEDRHARVFRAEDPRLVAGCSA